MSDRTVVSEEWDVSDVTLPEPSDPMPDERQTKLWEFGVPRCPDPEPDDRPEPVSQLVIDSRERTIPDDAIDPEPADDQPAVDDEPSTDSFTVEDRIRNYLDVHPGASPIEICGRFRLDPDEWKSTVRQIAVTEMYPADD